MKKRRRKIMSLAEVVTLVITIGGFVWVGGFQLSEIKHDIRDIYKRLDKIDGRLDRLETEFHKMDVRVNLLEQRKP